jgi:hypothetical protein
MYRAVGDLRSIPELHHLADERMRRSQAKHGQDTPPASIEAVAASVQRVQSMSREEEEVLVDEILKRQPNLLGHVVVLSKLNVPMEKVDRVLHVLLVLYDVFTRAGTVDLPTVPEDDLEHIDDDFHSPIPRPSRLQRFGTMVTSCGSRRLRGRSPGSSVGMSSRPGWPP